MNALFVYDPQDLEAPIPGGVQLCTREFLDVVKTAADHLAMLPVRPTLRTFTRLKRRLGLGSYLGYDAREISLERVDVQNDHRPTHVFLNRAELMRLAPSFHARWPGCRVIIMSHGNQSGDDLYEITGEEGRRRRGWKRLRATIQIGQDIATESRSRRRDIDAVCVMSTEEAVLERWLGTEITHWIPRVIHPHFLNWQPVSQRCGYVGTLDHTPNRIALEKLFDCVSRRSRPPNFEIRLAGGPSEFGQALAKKHSFVSYLGRLDNTALAAEAASWSLFLNPIFWLSRGASMKLGQALAWGLPIATTLSGARGYRLPADLLSPCSDSVEEFTANLQARLDDAVALRQDHKNIVDSVASWPQLERLGAELRQALA